MLKRHDTQQTVARSLQGMLLLTLMAVVTMAYPAVSAAQIFAQRGGFGLPTVDDADSEITGAVLKTDPDLEALLDKANRHAEEGNYRVATPLWQAVLERSGDSLYTEDDTHYFSISDQIEGILAKLPPDALAIYRVTADASARQILTEANIGLVASISINMIFREPCGFSKRSRCIIPTRPFRWTKFTPASRFAKPLWATAIKRRKHWPPVVALELIRQ